MTHRSTARVATDRGDRWRTQLVAHLGRKAEVRQTPEGEPQLVLAGGSCLLTTDAEALHLEADAPDEQALHRVEQVVGGHLERFAAREGLTVAWQRA